MSGRKAELQERLRVSLGSTKITSLSFTAHKESKRSNKQSTKKKEIVICVDSDQKQSRKRKANVQEKVENDSHMEQEEKKTESKSKSKSKKPKKTLAQKLMTEEGVNKRVALSPLINTSEVQAIIATKREKKSKNTKKTKGKASSLTDVERGEKPSRKKRKKLFNAAESYSHLVEQGDQVDFDSSTSMFAQIATSAKFKVPKLKQSITHVR